MAAVYLKSSEGWLSAELSKDEKLLGYIKKNSDLSSFFLIWRSNHASQDKVVGLTSI
jgi:hypothetical protein